MYTTATLLCLLGILVGGLALECYVCENQGDNRDKCAKTTIQCREEQDTCMTRVHLHAPIFWTPRSVKIHHIYKTCNSSSFCAREQRRLGLRCMRDWYKDWECVDCCQGDRCNYYVTLGSTAVEASVKVLFVIMATHVMFQARFFHRFLPSFLHIA